MIAPLSLSQEHSQQFINEYHGQFFKTVEKRAWKKKGKSRSKGRNKRAFWGLDKFFSDAVKAKDHFGGLKDRVGTYFGSDNSQVGEQQNGRLILTTHHNKTETSFQESSNGVSRVLHMCFNPLRPVGGRSLEPTA